MGMDRDYTCPDCGTGCKGYELLYPTASSKVLYVCPNCGCVQEEKEIERQLGNFEEV